MGFEVLAFPCNQSFLKEFKTNQEIIEHSQRHDINFTIFDKVNVTGKNCCELYKILKRSDQYTRMNVEFSFGRFLVDRNGNVFKYFDSSAEFSDVLEGIQEIL